MNIEKFTTIRGKWQDTYTKNDGTVTVGNIHHNQIQDTAYTVVASLLANQFLQINVPVETPTTYGITHVDYGSGQPSWDLEENQPIPQPLTDTQCNNAVYRQALTQAQVTFVPEDDEFGGDAVSLTPTNRIRVTLVLTENEFVGQLREFGLFCRYSDDVAVANQVNEGLMFNWVIHPLIEKDNTLRIDRVIEITISRC